MVFFKNGFKSNLKNYLRSQTAFKDFDFEGSNLSVLIDILSYNTYMNSYYLNMVAAEGFIDSAQLRDSVVSHAKTLNYLPGSFTSSKAVVDVEFVPDGTPANVTLPKHSTFTTSVSSNSYTFTTNERITIPADANGNYIASNVEIFEGDIVRELFVVNTANTDQRFVLNNTGVDVDSADASHRGLFSGAWHLWLLGRGRITWWIECRFGCRIASNNNIYDDVTRVENLGVDAPPTI